MKYSLKGIYSKDGQDKLLPRLGVIVYNHARLAAVVWALLLIFGVASYTTLLKREGFPSINVPFAVVSGTYFVNDPAKVDTDIARPVGDIILKDSRVKSLQSQSRGTFYALTIQYAEGTDVEAANRELDSRIKAANVVPKQASLKVESPKLGFTERGDDLVIATYLKNTSDNPASNAAQPSLAQLNSTQPTQQALKSEAEKLVGYIKAQNIADIESISVVDPFVNGINPATGRQEQSQAKFDRYGARLGLASNTTENQFFQSISVGVMQKDGSDVIKLDERLQEVLAGYNAQNANSSDFQSVISASYATDITAQISELQKALLEGLLAVLVIGSLVIAIRASIITVISMVTVLAITTAVLYATGYTLNTITLFALILCLGLVVDDTIIMVEAIDAQRRKLSDPRQIIRVATRKVSRAMVAATLTAALSFAPLIFIGGILGSFIRAIPITVITSLLISLVVALVFIPLFARFLLLGKKQMGATTKGGDLTMAEPAAGVEAKIANAIGRPMMWAQHSRKKLVGVGLTAVLIGSLFIVAGGFLFQKVTFNIFPPSKDSNGLIASLQFEPGTTITQAQTIADKATAIIGKELGPNFRTAAFYENASDQNAILAIQIVPYDERDVTAPQLQTQLNKAFQNFQGAKVAVSQADVGPPSSAFTVRIETTDRQAAFKLANDLSSYLLSQKLVRPSGETASVKEVTIADPGSYTRSEGESYVSVTASFNATDTTTLVTLAKSAVEKEFTAEKLASYGLGKDALNYDIGQEQENQDSFKALALAFPILLFAIYLLLALQFRSLMQPLLIFMAIPFSLFGITLGLYLTNNAFSFFAMLGFFALIGLSLKNTILLTDYANQLRRTGSTAIEAAVGALHERFRPLIATSLTAVVSLIPLALTSPFWEGLAVVLISGLLSSTFLVLTVFPYYYLGAEFMRLRVSRRAVFIWATTVGLCVAIGVLGLPLWLIPLALLTVLAAHLSDIRNRRNRSPQVYRIRR